MAEIRMEPVVLRKKDKGLEESFMLQQQAPSGDWLDMRELTNIPVEQVIKFMRRYAETYPDQIFRVNHTLTMKTEVVMQIAVTTNVIVEEPEKEQRANVVSLEAS